MNLISVPKPTMSQRCLTVDPGWNTGWAFWGNNTVAPSATGQYILKNKLRAKGTRTEDKLNYMFEQFEEVLNDLEPIFLYVEGTELWTTSTTSMASASSGNLFVLTYLIGGYLSMANRYGLLTRLIPANQWKGQLSKTAVQKRIFRRIGEVYVTDHIADAVGMGLSLKGEL